MNYLDASQFKLKHVFGGGFDKNSRKELCTCLHLICRETVYAQFNNAVQQLACY